MIFSEKSTDVKVKIEMTGICRKDRAPNISNGGSLELENKVIDCRCLLK